MGLAGLVDKQIKLNRKPKSQNIDIEDIIKNPKNKYEITNIDELANSILNDGLYRPLEVYKTDDDLYMLLGGERRFTALQKLYQEGLIDSDIPCLIYNSPNDDISERLQLITSNAQRDMSEQQKVVIAKELLDIIKINPDLKPKNTPTVEWLAPYLGCSPRTAQKYKNMAEVKNQQKKHKKQKTSTEKSLDDLTKLLKKFNKDLNNLYWQIPTTSREIQVTEIDGKTLDVNKIISKLAAITDLYVNSLAELQEQE